MLKPDDFFDLSQTEHLRLFDENHRYVWEAIGQIADYLKFRLKPEMKGEVRGTPYIEENVYIGEGTIIENGVTIMGPAWIGKNCQIRSGAYIRGNVIVGDQAVLGNSCEFKNCLLFNEAQVPHFSYVGDSILGHKAHLGAGVIISNLRTDQKEIVIDINGKRVQTTMRKMGAIIGDRVEVGCNAVLNPGSIIGRRGIIYPGVIWKGVLGEGKRVKHSNI